MKALGVAASAAIAFAPVSVVATTPVVAQAAPFAGLGADPKSCQWYPFSVVQYRISTEPTLREPAPTTAMPVQTPQVVAPSPPPPSAIPVVAADEEPTQPEWHSALQYVVLVIVMSLVAWPLGLPSNRTIDTPPIPPRPKPRRAGRGALAVRSALTFPTIDHRGAEVKRMVLVAAGHRCAIPACLIASCPSCCTWYDQKKEIDRQPIRMYKRNLGILNSRYSDFERRVFDQIAEADWRSFIVEAGFEVLLLHAVEDGLLKRVELSPVAIQHGEPTHHKYEVTDAGLNFVSRYIQGEDIS
jgi:hypothetical protein